ncbi:MAG: sulfite oxidase-like oxidoreductase [Alkalinema sp. RL_2_19]|nr:sulfite oxidase-like oxidoreductase [Alkalinema sp. RL_2_19]
MGKFFHQPSDDLRDRVPPGQHLATGFPVLTYGATQHIEPANWQLQISGLAQAQTITWHDLMTMPQSNFTADFHCVTTWSKLDVQWQGVKITDLFRHLHIEPTASHVMQHAYGGYTTNIALEDLLREENFLAHKLEGTAISADHGGPVRLIVPHLYAWKGAKWISGLEFLPQMELGFWERNGYHHRGEPFAQERYSDR